MKGNVPIPDLPLDDEAWIVACVTSVREGSAKSGKRYWDATAQNGTGRVAVKVWQEAYDDLQPLQPGIWKIRGRKALYQNQAQFVAEQYKAMTLDDYRVFQNAEPEWPRAYTMDIETLALPEFRDRAPAVLERDYRLGKMRSEQHA